MDELSRIPTQLCRETRSQFKVLMTHRSQHLSTTALTSKINVKICVEASNLGKCF